MINDMTKSDSCEGKNDEELYRLVKDLFVCPLCGNNPTEVTKIDDEGSIYGYFWLFCKKCGEGVEISDYASITKKTREKFLKLHKTVIN